MNARRTAGWMYLSLTLGIVLAANAVAHPIGTEEGTLSAKAPDSEPAGVATGLNARSASLSLQHGPARNVRDGRADLPSGLLTATGDERASASWLGQAQPLVDADQDPFQEADPLAAALPPMRNRKPPRSLNPPAPHSAQGEPASNAQPDEEMVAAIRELQRSLIETVAGVLDASRDIDGQVTFSLAGIEGFRYVAKDGEVSLGYGDTAMTVAQQGTSAATGRGPPPRPVHQEEQSGSEIIHFILEIVQYPLVWLTLLLLAVAKVALVVISRRARKRIRRRRSRTNQPVQQAKVKRQRVRVRFRIKRAPAAARRQEP